VHADSCGDDRPASGVREHEATRCTINAPSGDRRGFRRLDRKVERGVERPPGRLGLESLPLRDAEGKNMSRQDGGLVGSGRRR
jgi:hypothetical protein